MMMATRVLRFVDVRFMQVAKDGDQVREDMHLQVRNLREHRIRRRGARPGGH